MIIQKDKLYMLLGFIMILIGLMCNNFAIANNNGKMPVKDFISENKYPFFFLHQPLTDKTKFVFLCDVFYKFSIGDIIMFLGIMPLFYGLFKNKKCPKQ